MNAEANTRLFSLDAVRGFAIFAMVVAHTKPFIAPAPKWISIPEGALNDVAAPLFALIIGVTLAVTSSGLPDAARGRFRGQFCLKALALVALGFALEFEPSGVAIVLDYLGITMLLSLPLLFLRSRTLLWWAGSLLALTPAVVTFMRDVAVLTPTLLYPRSATTTVLDWLVLGRSYQVPVFLGMLALGIVLGRGMLRGGFPHARLFAASAAAFIFMEAAKFLVLPETVTSIRGGYFEVMRETALALAVFSAIVYVCDQATGSLARSVRRVLSFTAVQGRMALSIYVFHVLILMLAKAAESSAHASTARWFEFPRGWLIQLGLVLLCWLFAATWSRWFGTGPLERAIGLLSGRRTWARNRREASLASR